MRVLFARESGSRARGLPRVTATATCAFSTSTEDAEGNREAGGRASRRDLYLSVEDRRDVIELPIADDLDALRLLRKSNPPLLEWLRSPVVYHHDPVFAAEFTAKFYSPPRCFAHYLHMAFGNWRDYLRGRDAAGKVEELNGLFRRYALAAEKQSPAGIHLRRGDAPQPERRNKPCHFECSAWRIGTELLGQRWLKTTTKPQSP